MCPKCHSTAEEDDTNVTEICTRHLCVLKLHCSLLFYGKESYAICSPKRPFEAAVSLHVYALPTISLLKEPNHILKTPNLVGSASFFPPNAAIKLNPRTSLV
jgi:hypothetical protein